MRHILQGPHKDEFFKLTNEVREFQAEMYLLMLENPNRPMVAVTPDLCVECGPRQDGEEYVVEAACEQCGKERRVTFR